MSSLLSEYDSARMYGYKVHILLSFYGSALQNGVRRAIVRRPYAFSPL